MLPGKVNHFIGNDPAKWRTNISTYRKVRYESVYPDIDLIYYGDQSRLEYDFVVARDLARLRPPLRLMVEHIGPVPNLALALDAGLLLRDPFPIVNPLNWLNNGSDKNTRVMIFLQSFPAVPGEPPSEVIVNLANGNQTFDIFAEDVRPLANTDLTQVTFRLPDQLSPGNYVIKVTAHGEITNSATLRISP